jgi:outer membrane protein TolC
MVEAEVRQTVTVADAAEATTEVREAGARSARAWLAAAESSFDMGVAETRDLADAYQAYVRSRAALLQALHDERIARVEAAHAKGGR